MVSQSSCLNNNAWEQDTPQAPAASLQRHYCDMWFTHGSHGYLALFASTGAVVELSELSFIWDYACCLAGWTAPRAGRAAVR